MSTLVDRIKKTEIAKKNYFETVVNNRWNKVGIVLAGIGLLTLGLGVMYGIKRGYSSWIDYITHERERAFWDKVRKECVTVTIGPASLGVARFTGVLLAATPSVLSLCSAGFGLLLMFRPAEVLSSNAPNSKQDEIALKKMKRNWQNR